MQKTIQLEKNLYQAQVFSCENKEALNEFEHLVNENQLTCFDSIDDQLLELAKCHNPALAKDENALRAALNPGIERIDQTRFGNWVIYHWRKTAVHLLPEPDFRLVRTNRNRNKITLEEQEILRLKTVLIIGLSVGQSAALTYAMQRACGKLILADFDKLSLSNMNRLRASVADLGQEKSVIAARQIAEMDPYLNVELVPGGLTEENLMDLVSRADLVVEECDNLPLKVLVREAAARLGIPVIMETSDRGMLDVERYDIDPNYPVMHGLIPENMRSRIRELTTAERRELFNHIVDFPKLSQAMKDSIPLIGSELLSLPQLGADISLGGALTTNAGMKILLGRKLNSGRYYVDLDRIFASQ